MGACVCVSVCMCAQDRVNMFCVWLYSFWGSGEIYARIVVVVLRLQNFLMRLTIELEWLR